MPNPITVLLPPSTQIFVHALSHAALPQRILIAPPQGHGDPAAFSGSGENVTMSLEVPGFITRPSDGWASFTTLDSDDPDERFEYTVTVAEGCDLHSAPYEAEAGPEGARSRYATVMIVSEDLTDGDFNDSVLLFTYFRPPRR